jgi:hypothetical protein
MSATSLTTAQQCEQLYYWQYDKNFREVWKSVGLSTGTIMHVGEESYMRGHSLEKAIEAMEGEAAEEGFDEDPLFNIRNRAYIKGYYAQWEDADAQLFAEKRYEVLGIEEEFAFDYVIDGVGTRFVGKMDAVVKDNVTGEIILWEHKNVSNKDAMDPSSLYYRLLPMNNQLAIYVSYLQQKFNSPVSVMYDVVVTSPRMKPGQVKKGLKRRKDESLEDWETRKANNMETLPQFAERIEQLYLDSGERYMRFPVQIMNSQVESRMSELCRLAQRIDVMDEPIRNTHRCSSYGGCAFVNSCLGIEDPATSPRFEIKERTHIELSKKE